MSDGVDDETGEILQHHRKDENVMYRQVFSLDYDDIDDMDRFIENIQSKCNILLISCIALLDIEMCKTKKMKITSEI